MGAVRGLAALLLCLYGSAALGCGHCVEDKVAAVYDHAVLLQARAQHNDVAYFAIEGDLPGGERLRRVVEAAARGVAGVTPGSVRVSVELAALSLAFDPRRTSAAAVREAVQRRLGAQKLRLLEMKLQLH